MIQEPFPHSNRPLTVRPSAFGPLWHSPLHSIIAKFHDREVAMNAVQCGAGLGLHAMR